MEKTLTKVDDSPSLARSSDNKAILNTDVVALNAYKQRRQRERKMDFIFNEFDSVVRDIAEIKEMLAAILVKLEKI